MQKIYYRCCSYFLFSFQVSNTFPCSISLSVSLNKNWKGFKERERVSCRYDYKHPSNVIHNTLEINNHTNRCSFYSYCVLCKQPQGSNLLQLFSWDIKHVISKKFLEGGYRYLAMPQWEYFQSSRIQFDLVSVILCSICNFNKFIWYKVCGGTYPP